MHAYRFIGFTSLDDLQLQAAPDPRPQRGEVLVRVRAVALNYRDIAMLKGRSARAQEGFDPRERWGG